MQIQKSLVAKSVVGRVIPVAPRYASSKVAVRASTESRSDSSTISRRDAMLASVAMTSSASLLLPQASFAGLFNDDDEVKAQYVKSTTDVLAKVNSVLALPRDDPAKDAAVAVSETESYHKNHFLILPLQSLRSDINMWVATYRREPRVSGRPSYGNTYSALNALAGHFNNFGAQAPIPKKRLERLVKELDDASLFLTRGR